MSVSRVRGRRGRGGVGIFIYVSFVLKNISRLRFKPQSASRNQKQNDRTSSAASGAGCTAGRAGGGSGGGISVCIGLASGSAD